jgi:molybdopterin-guanine dinucleotide biosynthesis protein A
MLGVFSRVVVSVRPDDNLGILPVDRVKDQYPESGPIGGITSVLETGEESIFCVACDMPFVNPKLVEYVSSFEGFDAVIPIWADRLQVLHAVYSRSILPLFQIAVRDEHLRISDVFPRANIHYISASEIKEMDPSGASFENLNTPAEYEKLLGKTLQ